MPPLSAVLITLNEEERLPAALASVAFCDEVVVVDAGSTDRTRELAESAGARVIVNAPWPGFVTQKNRAVAEARHDWILSLDADERVSFALRSEILARRDHWEHAGYRIRRLVFYLGRFIRGTDWYPDLQLRVFDRRRGQWEGGLVHESVRVTGPVGRLAGTIEHFPYRDISDHLKRMDTYTSLWAQHAYQTGRRTSLLALAAAPFACFLRNYFLKRGVFLGEVGLTVSILNTWYAFSKMAKLRELQRLAFRTEAPRNSIGAQ